jgi:hypothetical protein
VSLQGKARKIQDVPPETHCIFSLENPHQEQEQVSRNGSSHANRLSEELSAPLVASAEEHVNIIKLWPWVNEVRVTFASKVFLQTVYLQDADNCVAASTFGDCDAAIQADGVGKNFPSAWLHSVTPVSMTSPRVVLVQDQGTLVGLVTVKDVLRFNAMEGSGRNSSGDERGGLDGVLEEVWTWTFNFWHGLARGTGFYTRQQSL